MILINGETADSVPVSDRGLQYGDGLFETILLRSGRPVLWKRHMARLQSGCERLGISFDTAALETDLALLQNSCASDGVLKIIVSRGQGGRGYKPPQMSRPTRILQIHPLPEGIAERAAAGIAVLACRHPLSLNSSLAGLKHLNRLDQVLASAELTEDHAEGLMSDSLDNVIEGTRSNVFIVTERGIATPDLSRSGVAGIMRALLLELFEAHDRRVDIRSLSFGEAEMAREVFVCNSVFGIWPVVRLHRGGQVHNFKIGEVTRQAQTWLRDIF